MSEPAEYPRGTEPVSSDKKYEVLAGEADGFYKILVTVSTAFFGGSLLYLEKIARHATPISIVVLALGWFALVLAIFWVTDVRRQNLESLRLAMEGKYDEARAVDAQTRLGSRRAQWSMLVGMSLI